MSVESVLLDGAQVVPPVTTAATGTGVVVFNGVTLEVRGDVITTGVAGTAARRELQNRGRHCNSSASLTGR